MLGHRQGHDRRADDVKWKRSTLQRGESLPHILHVEDDQSLAAIVREAMSRNAIVTSARSVAAARQLLATQHFDAVILDVALPDGSGIELLPDHKPAQASAHRYRFLHGR